ncbi:MAG: hypothetical protein RL757_2616 [Bacteroidota bacterium]
MKSLKYFFLFVDIAFILYWSITALHLLPPDLLYNDYTNPILVHWNWSFFPLDMFISATGLYSVFLSSQRNEKWRIFALISLILTSVSGLQAISYWILAADYDLTWWLPNLFLLLYPFAFFNGIIKKVIIK